MMNSFKNCLSLVPVLLLVATCSSPKEEQKESVAVIVERTITESGIEAAVAKYRELKSDSSGGYIFDESELDDLGHRLLRSGKTAEAIQIFELNVEMYPQSWQAYASLGEACVWADEKDKARANFEKSLQLNADNEQAAMRLSRIEGEAYDEERETKEPLRFLPGESTGLQGPYLGQKPPGLEPKIFAPGIVSTQGSFEFSCTFSPDGRELYFNRGPHIMVSRWKEEGWTAPEPALFDTEHLDHEPHITHDGQKMFFGSARPRPDVEEGENPYAIYVMTREGEGWGAPTVHGPGMYVTTSANGNYYVTDTSRPDDSGVLVRAEYIDGTYTEVEELVGGMNSRYADWHPCIAPDESYLVFDSSRPGGQGGEGDFYVCFRREDGTWGEALNVGDRINTPGGNMCGYITPDGEYFFYHAKRDVYWVSTKAIESLRP